MGNNRCDGEEMIEVTNNRNDVIIDKVEKKE